MRAAPAVHVSVTRFGLWRAAVGGVLALVWLVVVAWAVSHGRARGGMPSAPVGGVAAAALAVATGLATRLVATRPFDLRWDGRSWYLGPTAPSTRRPTTVDAVPGDLHATIDLGSWLLLCFAPERQSTQRAVRHWLPVQRRGLEPAWHALRCAVHSPRPAAASLE